MSSSLVRRGLDMYKDDIPQSSGSKGRSLDMYKDDIPQSSGSKGKKKATKELTEKELTQLVGTNKKGYRRKLKRLHTKQDDATLKGKKVKSHEKLYESHLRHDMTDANINALNFMKLLNKDEKKVMEQAAQRHEAKNAGRKHRKSQKEAAKDSGNTDTNSVFTESDFEKFFKEYNFT